MSLQTLYCNASCECIPDQCSLLTDNYTHIITELRIPCVRSTGSTLITLVRIGYVEIKVRKGATLLLQYWGKMAERGRIESFQVKFPLSLAPNDQIRSLNVFFYTVCLHTYIIIFKSNEKFHKELIDPYINL